MSDYAHMTPEERFTKIENLLAAISEHQASFDERQAWFDQRQASFDQRQASFDQRQVRFDERQALHAEQSARHDEEIREIREIQKAAGIAFLKLTETQHKISKALRDLAAKQELLTETVDRIVRNRDQPPS